MELIIGAIILGTIAAVSKATKKTPIKIPIRVDNKKPRRESN